MSVCCGSGLDVRMEEKMKLYIIGNGFDLGHNLHTKYWDFRLYLEKLYPEFLKQFEEHYYIYPNMTQDQKCNLLWNELETNLANIDEDIIISNSISIEMGLESGDIGIEDTLYQYFSAEYKYIRKLSKYLKQWVRTIKIRDTKKKSSLITDDSIYITFNYTAVLENVYNIKSSQITHIHGSLRNNDIDPVLGHGNFNRIKDIREKREKATILFDEKMISVCKALEDYYKKTFKDVNKYSFKLSCLSNYEISEICVIGHSLAGVDMPYFTEMDRMTNRKAIWKVYYYCPDEKSRLISNLVSIGIEEQRIQLLPSSMFYDL